MCIKIIVNQPNYLPDKDLSNWKECTSFYGFNSCSDWPF